MAKVSHKSWFPYESIVGWFTAVVGLVGVWLFPRWLMGHDAPWGTAWLSFIALTIAYFMIRGMRGMMFSTASVKIADGQLLIDGRAVAADDIAATSSDDRQVAVYLRNGGVWTIATPKAAKLAVDIERLRNAAAVIPASDAASGALWSVVGWVSLAAVAQFAATRDVAPWIQALWLLPPVVAWIAVAIRASRTRFATVGRDGVLFKDEFVACERIERIERRHDELRIFVRDGDMMMIPDRSTRITYALERVLESLGDARTVRLREDHAGVLARDGRSIADWKDKLQKLIAHDYRAEALRIEDLEAILEDGSAEPEQRIAAALALPRDNKTIGRIRVAASHSADDSIRVALEAAADDALMEAHLMAWRHR